MKQPMVKFSYTLELDDLIESFSSAPFEVKYLFNGFDIISYYDTGHEKHEEHEEHEKHEEHEELTHSDMKILFLESTKVTPNTIPSPYGEIEIFSEIVSQKGIILKDNSLFSSIRCPKREFINLASLPFPIDNLDVINSERVNHSAYNITYENDIFTLHFCEYPDKTKIIRILPDTDLVSKERLDNFIRKLKLDPNMKLSCILEERFMYYAIYEKNQKED